MAFVSSKVKEAEEVEGSGIKSTGEPANKIIVSDGSDRVTWNPISELTDEKVKVGLSGTSDYLNDEEFQQDSSNHITILSLAWSKISKVGSNLTDLVTRNHNDLQNIGEDDHHPKLHHANHEDGGIDEINVDDLSGELADPQKQKSMQLAFATDSDPFVYTGNSSYSVAARFVVRGSAEEGTPIHIKVVAGGDGNTMKVKLYDKTNAKTIAEKTDIPDLSGDTELYDLGTIANYPVSEAVFEVQIEAGSDIGDYANISAIILEW